MAYVYDYLTEEEYKKYNLATILPRYEYSQYYDVVISRETDTFLKKTGVDRDSWGRFEYYIFIPRLPR